MKAAAKYFLTLILTLVMCAGVCSMEAAASASGGSCGDDLTWTLKDGVLTISGTGTMTDYASASNRAPWYSARKTITTVNIDNGVTSIGSYAFDYCGKLTDITIPDSVTSIGKCAFVGCEDLSGVTIPNSVTSIDTYTFYGCSSLANVTIPDSVASIGTYAFYGCSSLTGATLPDGLTSLADGMFMDCESLTSVTLPDGVVSIGRCAFSGCSSLTSVTLPDAVTSIEDSAFWDCGNLTDVYYNGTEEAWNDISIGSSNEYLTSATVNYASAEFPGISSVKNKAKGVKVKWSAVSGATKYRVYYKGGSVKNWTKAGDTTGTSYTVTGLTSGKTYSFTVQCIAPDKGSYDTTGVSIRYLNAGEVKSLTNTSSGVKIKWKKVSGASGYYVYRKSGSGSWEKIKTISKSGTTSYTDNGVKKKNGTTYTYAVRPYSGKAKGSYFSAKTVRLTGVSLSSVKNANGSKLTVGWKKNSKATGYQLQYSQNSDFSSSQTVTVKQKSTTSVTLSELEAGKKYYVRIRAYKTVSGKKYTSAWSSKKSVTVSKKIYLL